MLTLPLGHKVLVYLEKIGWQLYKRVLVWDSELDVVLWSGMISTFSINVVSPFHDRNVSETINSAARRPSYQTEDFATASSEQERTKMTRSQARKEQGEPFRLIVESMIKDFYFSSKMAEISSLPKMGGFRNTPETGAKRQSLYRFRLIHEVTSDGRTLSSFCVATCSAQDQNHGLFTAAPVIKRISLCTLLSISATTRCRSHICYVRMALIMSKTRMWRPAYMKSRKEMNVNNRNVLKAVEPVSGMLEISIHWFKTFIDYHKSFFEMSQTASKPCLMVLCLREPLRDSMVSSGYKLMAVLALKRNMILSCRNNVRRNSPRRHKKSLDVRSAISMIWSAALRMMHLSWIKLTTLTPWKRLITAKAGLWDVYAVSVPNMRMQPSQLFQTR